MKKILALLLAAIILLLAGCNKAAEDDQPIENTEPQVEAELPEETPKETDPVPSEPEPPVPETILGTILADKTAVVLKTVNRDDVLDVVGEYDDSYYIVKLDEGYGLVEKRLVRMDGEEPYAQWEGYANYGAVVYSHYYFCYSEGIVTKRRYVRYFKKGESNWRT